MDKTTALAYYSAWIKEIQRKIECRESIAPKTISNAYQTEFGAWMVGNGKVYEDLPEYAALMAAVIEFHKVVGALAATAKLLDHSRAINLFPNNDSLFRAGCRLRVAISELFWAIDECETAQPWKTTTFTGDGASAASAILGANSGARP